MTTKGGIDVAELDAATAAEPQQPQSPQQPKPPKLYRPKDVAAQLGPDGLDVGIVYRWIRKGLIGVVRDGQRIWIPESELQRLISQAQATRQ